MSDISLNREPLTTEELAEWETFCQSWPCFEPQYVARLIAEVKRLRAEVQRLTHRAAMAEWQVEQAEDLLA